MEKYFEDHGEDCSFCGDPRPAGFLSWMRAYKVYNGSHADEGSLLFICSRCGEKPDNHWIKDKNQPSDSFVVGEIGQLGQNLSEEYKHCHVYGPNTLEYMGVDPRTKPTLGVSSTAHSAATRSSHLETLLIWRTIEYGEDGEPILRELLKWNSCSVTSETCNLATLRMCEKHSRYGWKRLIDTLFAEFSEEAPYILAIERGRYKGRKINVMPNGDLPSVKVRIEPFKSFAEEEAYDDEIYDPLDAVKEKLAEESESNLVKIVLHLDKCNKLKASIKARFIKKWASGDFDDLTYSTFETIESMSQQLILFEITEQLESGVITSAREGYTNVGGVWVRDRKPIAAVAGSVPPPPPPPMIVEPKSSGTQHSRSDSELSQLGHILEGRIAELERTIAAVKESILLPKIASECAGKYIQIFKREDKSKRLSFGGFGAAQEYKSEGWASIDEMFKVEEIRNLSPEPVVEEETHRIHAAMEEPLDDDGASDLESATKFMTVAQTSTRQRRVTRNVPAYWRIYTRTEAGADDVYYNWLWDKKMKLSTVLLFNKDYGRTEIIPAGEWLQVNNEGYKTVKQADIHVDTSKGRFAALLIPHNLVLRDLGWQMAQLAELIGKPFPVSSWKKVTKTEAQWAEYDRWKANRRAKLVKRRAAGKPEEKGKKVRPEEPEGPKKKPETPETPESTPKLNSDYGTDLNNAFDRVWQGIRELYDGGTDGEIGVDDIPFPPKWKPIIGKTASFEERVSGRGDTTSEAIYATLGKLGPRPIRASAMLQLSQKVWEVSRYLQGEENDGVYSQRGLDHFIRATITNMQVNGEKVKTDHYRDVNKLITRAKIVVKAAADDDSSTKLTETEVMDFVNKGLQQNKSGAMLTIATQMARTVANPVKGESNAYFLMLHAALRNAITDDFGDDDSGSLMSRIVDRINTDSPARKWTNRRLGPKAIVRNYSQVLHAKEMKVHYVNDNTKPQSVSTRRIDNDARKGVELLVNLYSLKVVSSNTAQATSLVVDTTNLNQLNFNLDNRVPETSGKSGTSETKSTNAEILTAVNTGVLDDKNPLMSNITKQLARMVADKTENETNIYFSTLHAALRDAITDDFGNDEAGSLLSRIVDRFNTDSPARKWTKRKLGVSAVNRAYSPLLQPKTFQVTVTNDTTRKQDVTLGRADNDNTKQIVLNVNMHSLQVVQTNTAAATSLAVSTVNLNTLNFNVDTRVAAGGGGLSDRNRRILNRVIGNLYKWNTHSTMVGRGLGDGGVLHNPETTGEASEIRLVKGTQIAFLDH